MKLDPISCQLWFQYIMIFHFSKCGPRISDAAADKLKNRYVLMRSGAKEHERETDKKTSIPITVRQLEAIVRISESLAKMEMKPFASDAHVDEALRLFQVSTLDAARTGNLAGKLSKKWFIFSDYIDMETNLVSLCKLMCHHHVSLLAGQYLNFIILTWAHIFPDTENYYSFQSCLT